MKTNKIFKIVLFISFLIEVTPVSSQTFNIEGEIRPRVEYQDGYSKPISTANDPGIFTSQRTRLGVSYETGTLKAKITLQDARIFGQFANSSSDGTTGIYEAWAEMLLIPGGTLKIGRQTVKYDDNRIFAAPSWSIKGITHDMALFKYKINDFETHLGIAYNNNKEISTETFYTPVDKYRMLSYLWLSKPLFKGATLSAIIVDEGTQDTVGTGTNYKKLNMNHAFTVGGNLKYQHSEVPISALATAYFQAGENNSGTKMNGKLLALKINYTFNSIISARLGTDYFSGDSNGSTDGTTSTFKKLYGSNHAFNGYIDYWKAPVSEGLLDYFGCITYKVSKKLNFDGAFHVFTTDKQLKSGGAEVGKDLGSELDIVVNYNLNSLSTIQGGYCRYFETSNTLLAKGMSASTNIRTPQFVYVMFTVKIHNS